MMTKIDHVAIYAQDLEMMKDFFVQLFQGQAHELYHNPKTGLRSYFITFNNGARLEIMNRPEIQTSKESDFFTGYSHIAFSVGSREEVNILTETLKEQGFEICSLPRVTGDGYYESCVLGPEKIRIEITE